MTGITRNTVSLILIGTVLLFGCSTKFGPASIATGRSVYNEVIDRTESEQLLNMIVRERYDDTYGMLAVASVTANIRARASLGAEVGVGPSSNYDGNLVPLSGGVAYEENPTISYVPLSGADFLIRMLTPLSFRESFAIFAGHRGTNGRLVSATVIRVNGLDNPAFIPDGPAADEFLRAVELWERLASDRAVRFRQDPEGEPHFVLEVHGAGDVEAAREWLGLLQIDRRIQSGDPLVIPVDVGLGDPDSQTLRVEFGSTLDLIRLAGFGIDTPAEHLDANVVTPPRTGVTPFLHIRTSRSRPKEAAVRLRYRDWWYYVADSDPASKQAFAVLRTIIGLRLHETGAKQASPVLTIPVG